MSTKKTSTVIRAELARALAEAFKIHRLQSEEFLETTLEEIGAALARGESVKLTNFGTFKLLSKKSRLGRNPRTLEPAKIKARRVISFHSSLELKTRLNAP
ncbi:MAG: HU family DNA-binding protein [Holosporales bacterium]|nr:HU family DNA-binding protein [Holosporales bacterium]